MTREDMMSALLNSMRDPVLFVDTAHNIRFMNRAAEAHYEEGERLLGQSVLTCHNEESQKMIHEIFDAMKKGEDERLITDNEKHRIYMRAVRDKRGELIGYYERYEPPRG